jgi:NAD(P)-dependent dehydrogenase (short-subunit alcohol dehydrogenase family)
MMGKRFVDRTALVTGGGTGIGRAIAERLATEGARVVVASRNREHLDPTVDALRALGADADSVALDVRDAAAVADAFDRVERRFGGVDLLVNNAAGNFVVPSEDLSPNGWRSVLDIVATGSFQCTREFGRRRIAAQRPGSVLSVIATYAWTGHPGVVHSAAAKAAVSSMTRTLAVEWARFGLRLNCVAPGPTETEGAGRALWADEAARERILASVPAARFAAPEEIAAAAAFLLSDDAAYVTGEVLVVDGGQSLGKQVYGDDVTWESGVSS